MFVHKLTIASLGLALTFVPSVQGVKGHLRTSLVDRDTKQYQEPDAPYYYDNSTIIENDFVDLGSFYNNLDTFDYNTTDDYDLEPFEPVEVNRILLQSNDTESRDVPDIRTNKVSRRTQGSWFALRSMKNWKALDAQGKTHLTALHTWDFHGRAVNNNQVFRGIRHTAPRVSWTFNLFGTNLCLDGYQGRGKRVVVFDCDGTNDQKWIEYSGRQLAPVTHPGLCIDIWEASDRNGAPVILWDCHNGSNQKWARTGV